MIVFETRKHTFRPRYRWKERAEDIYNLFSFEIEKIARQWLKQTMNVLDDNRIVEKNWKKISSQQEMDAIVDRWADMLFIEIKCSNGIKANRQNARKRAKRQLSTALKTVEWKLDAKWALLHVSKYYTWFQHIFPSGEKKQKSSISTVTRNIKWTSYSFNEYKVSAQKMYNWWVDHSVVSDKDLYKKREDIILGK